MEIEQEVEILHQFKPIFEREYRYYIYKGGRGGGKSFGVADSLLILGQMSKERILCTREIQKSIENSSYKLLCDRIAYYEFDNYEITKTSIVNKATGTEFIFAGLSDITGTADSLKSIENISICWCFPAGTKVDGKNIEEINVGDKILSYNHTKKTIEKKTVLRVMKRKTPKELICLNFGKKNSIICTKEHPIYVVGVGYKKAKDIKCGDIVYEKVKFTKRSTLFRRLWKNVADCCSTTQNKVCEKWRILLSGLHKKNQFGKNEKPQSNGKRSIKKENDKDFAFGWAQTNNDRWKWTWLYKSTKSSCKRAWAWLVVRASNTNRTLSGRKQPSNKLQSGFGKHLLWNSNRVRWSRTLRRYCKARRCKEREILKKQRVDSVKILEQRSLKQLGLCDGGDYVYNIEVQGNNNYFANGLLVHNCEEAQTVSSNSFKKLTPSIRGKNSLGQGSIIIMTYNPDTVFDPVYLEFVKEPKPRTLITHINYTDNPYCPKELIEEAEHLRQTKPDEYKKIWLGVPDDLSERAVVKYFSDDNIRKVNYCEDEDLILTMDFNVDPMMWCVCHKDDDSLYQLDEIVIENCTTFDAVSEFINRYPKHKGNIILCGDASGNYRKTQSNLSDYLIVRNALIKHGYEVDKIIQNTRPFNPPIKNRVRAFNNLVYDDTGKRRYFVDPKCKWTIFNMQTLAYKEGTSIIDLPTPAKIESNPDLKYVGHIFDAISYPVEYYWQIVPFNEAHDVVINPQEQFTFKNIIERNKYDE